jgi:DNA-binding Lrp family transcriptional regulator
LRPIKPAWPRQRTCYHVASSDAAIDLKRRRSVNHWSHRPDMQTIFVNIKCELGKAYEVADQAVQTIEQVSEVHSTSGQYDLMLKCFLGDQDDIGHFVTESVQTLPGVKDTFTIVAYKAFG